MSQLQEGDACQSEYETNLDAPARDALQNNPRRQSNVWYDSEDSNKTRIPPPKMPWVPLFSDHTPEHDSNGNIITRFESVVDQFGCLDYKNKAMNFENAKRMIEWMMAKGQKRIARDAEEKKKAKIQQHNTKHNGNANIDLRGVQYLVPNPTYDRNFKPSQTQHRPDKPKKKVSPSRALKNAQHREDIKLFKAERKAVRDASSSDLSVRPNPFEPKSVTPLAAKRAKGGRG
jgi:Uri superfamily endonuclease